MTTAEFVAWMNENVLANHFSAGSSFGQRTNTPHNP